MLAFLDAFLTIPCYCFAICVPLFSVKETDKKVYSIGFEHTNYIVRGNLCFALSVHEISNNHFYTTNPVSKLFFGRRGGPVDNYRDVR